LNFNEQIAYLFYHRGKSTHPGAVIDLCQNPDDPSRVKYLKGKKEEDFTRLTIRIF